MRRRQLAGTCRMVLEGSARMRCVKLVGRSTSGRSTVRLGVAGASASAMTTSSRLAGAPRGAHDDVTHSRGPGLTGLSTSIADPSAHSSETTTGGSRASDSLNRREQGASGLVHRGARVLVRNVSHEARNGGETPARTLAAPVVTITKRRKSGHWRWRSRVGQNRSGHARLNSCNACTRKRVRVREVYSRGRPRNRRRSRRRCVPTIRGPTRLSKRGREHRCSDVLHRGSR